MFYAKNTFQYKFITNKIEDTCIVVVLERSSAPAHRTWAAAHNLRRRSHSRWAWFGGRRRAAAERKRARDYCSCARRRCARVCARNWVRRRRCLSDTPPRRPHPFSSDSAPPWEAAAQFSQIGCLDRPIGSGRNRFRSKNKFIDCLTTKLTWRVDCTNCI